jgi:transcriptional regulator with AAA-type ATPase domain
MSGIDRDHDHAGGIPEQAVRPLQLQPDGEDRGTPAPVRRLTERDLVGVSVRDASGPPDTIAVPEPAPAAAPAAVADESSLVMVERDHVIRTLERAGGNKTRAAALLGISRRSLYRLIEVHGLAHMVKERKGNGQRDPGNLPKDEDSDDTVEIEDIP